MTDPNATPPKHHAKLLRFIAQLRTDQPLIHKELIDCLKDDPTIGAQHLYARIREAGLLNQSQHAHLH